MTTTLAPRDDPAIEAITKPFEDSLQQLDQERGWSMTEIWRDCRRMHDENAMLRQNLLQLEVVWQEEMAQWSSTRKIITDALKESHKTEAGHLDTEALKNILALNETVTKTISRLNSAIKDLRKEIRQSEFQSRFFFHVNDIQQFMMGLTAIMGKYIPQEQLVNAITAVKQLQKVIDIQSTTKETDDGQDT